MYNQKKPNETKTVTFSEDKLLLPEKSGFTFLKVEDIMYCKAILGYTEIFVKERIKPFLVRLTLKELELKLARANFFRIHKSHLINLNYVFRFDFSKGDKVVLDNGEKLELARRRKKDFMEAIVEM